LQALADAVVALGHMASHLVHDPAEVCLIKIIEGKSEEIVQDS